MKRRITRRGLCGLLATALTGTSVMACSHSGYDGPVSDHFDGKYFHNQVKTRDKSLVDVLKWRFNRELPVDAGWQYIDHKAEVSVPVRVSDGVLATFINHATVLVQVGGKNILTDPVWSERASPVSFLGPKRYHPPAMSLDQLPSIDAVVISHNHYDHLDLATLKQLQAKFQPVFITGLGNRELLQSSGLGNIIELDWWQSHALDGGVVITGTPAQHWSTRNRIDRNRTLWLGFLIGDQQMLAYFAGDTGMGPHFSQIRERFGPVDLALLPIGSYLHRGFMQEFHMSPDDALEAHRLLGARQSMAIHFGTFNLGDDGQNTARNRLEALLLEAQQTDFMVPEPGGQIRR